MLILKVFGIIGAIFVILDSSSYSFCYETMFQHVKHIKNRKIRLAFETFIVCTVLCFVSLIVLTLMGIS